MSSPRLGVPNKTYLWHLSLLFAISFVIRFIGQPSYPACFHRDEAEWAYNAFSISKTGRDEWGAFMPLHFKFNGEYHVPLVMYLPALLFTFLPANEVTFRLPFIILGSVIPILGLLFARKITGNNALAWFFAGLLAINPWQIMNARASGELSILSLFFGIAGFYWFFSYLKSQREKDLVWGGLCFVVTYFSYIASRFDMPLLIGLWWLVYRDRLKLKNRLKVFLLGLIVVPYVLVGLYPNRFTGTNIFSKHLNLLTEHQTQQENYPLLSTVTAFVKVGKNVGLEFIDNYFDYLNPYYIFRDMGEYDRTNLKDSGSLYTLEFVFVILGTAWLISQKNARLKAFLIWWLFLTPIVGALTHNYPDRPNTARTVYFYFMLSLLSAAGLFYFWEMSRKARWGRTLRVWLVLIGMVNVVFVWGQFIRQGNQVMAQSRGCGYEELISYTESVKSRFDEIVMGTVYDNPYVQFLWYTKYPPETYHEFLHTTPPENSVVIMFDDDLTRVWKLDQYVYMHSSCVVRSRPDTLYVGNFKDCRERYGIRVLRDARRGLVVMKLPKNPLYTTDMMVYKEEKIIKRLDGSVAFNAYSYDTELGEEPYSQEELNHLEPADL